MRKVLLILLLASTNAIAEPTLKLDKERYDCDDTISAGLLLDSEIRASQGVQFRWIAPTGHTQDTSYIEGNRASIEYNAWLKLNRPTGASLISWLEPAAGLLNFIGDWKVQASVDGNVVVEKTFTVEC